MKSLSVGVLLDNIKQSFKNTRLENIPNKPAKYSVRSTRRGTNRRTSEKRTFGEVMLNTVGKKHMIYMVILSVLSVIFSVIYHQSWLGTALILCTTGGLLGLQYYKMKHFEKNFAMYDNLWSNKVIKKDADGNRSEVSVDDVELGDTIILECGRIVQCDVSVQGDSVMVDTYHITGTSALQKKEEGSIIEAGSRIVQGSTEGVVLQYKKKTADLLVEYAKRQNRKRVVSESSLSKVLSTVTIVAVITLILTFCSTFFYFEYQTSVFEKLLNILVTCYPFGITLVSTILLGSVIKEMANKGITIKDFKSIGFSALVDTICFDVRDILSLAIGKVTEIHTFDNHDVKNCTVELLNAISATTIYNKDSDMALEGSLSAFVNKKGSFEKSKCEIFETDENIISATYESKGKKYLFVRGDICVLQKYITKYPVEKEKSTKEPKLNNVDYTNVVTKEIDMHVKGLSTVSYGYKVLEKDEEINLSGLTYLGTVGVQYDYLNNIHSALPKLEKMGISSKIVTCEPREAVEGIAHSLGMLNSEDDIVSMSDLYVSGEDLKSEQAPTDKVSEKSVDTPTEETNKFKKFVRQFIKEVKAGIRVTFGKKEKSVEKVYRGINLEKLANVSVIYGCTVSEKSLVMQALRKCGKMTAFVGNGLCNAAVLEASDVGMTFGSKDSSADVELEEDMGVLPDYIWSCRKAYNYLREFLQYFGLCCFGRLFALLLISLMGYGNVLSFNHCVLANILSILPFVLWKNETSKDMSCKSAEWSKAPLNVNDCIHIVFNGVLLVVMLMFSYLYALRVHKLVEMNIVYTVSFAMTVFAQYVISFMWFNRERDAFKFRKCKNYLVLVVGIILLCMFLYIPPMALLFDLSPLGTYDWALLVVGSVLLILANEVTKFLNYESEKPDKDNSAVVKSK